MAFRFELIHTDWETGARDGSSVEGQQTHNQAVREDGNANSHEVFPSVSQNPERNISYLASIAGGKSCRPSVWIGLNMFDSACWGGGISARYRKIFRKAYIAYHVQKGPGYPGRWSVVVRLAVEYATKSAGPTPWLALHGRLPF